MLTLAATGAGSLGHLHRTDVGGRHGRERGFLCARRVYWADLSTTEAPCMECLWAHRIVGVAAGDSMLRFSCTR